MEPAAQIGPYQLVRELGRGGMGVVWEARHPVLGTPVALKLLSDPLADEETRSRFLREARACAELRHPHVVRVLDAGEDRGRPWLVMDLLQGESLAQRLRRGPLPPEEAVGIVAVLAQALVHVHAQGVLHRDIKPANLLLTGAGPVLIDFGLARDARLEHQRLTRTGEILGTPEFMAPEQAQGDPAQVDARADVYALGATLHALLTGHPPFRGSSALDVLRRVLSDPPPSPAVEARLDALVLRCLQKDPAARHTSAAELARDLEAWLDTRARPREASRSPSGLAAAAVLLLGAAVALGVALRPRAPAPEPTPVSLAPPATGPVPAPGPGATAPETPSAGLEQRLAEVEDLLRRRAWDSLAPASERLVAEAAEEPRAWRLHGEALLRMAVYRPAAVDLVQAEAALLRATQLEPGSADGHALLALCRRELERQGRTQDPPVWPGDVERALERGHQASGLAWAAELGRLVHTLPPSNAVLPGGQWALALRVARDRALALAPRSLLVHHAVGEAEMELFIRGAAELDQVLEAWRRGLTLDPTDPVCLVQQGFAHKTAFEQQRGADPGGATARGSAEAALHGYEQAIAADPDYWYPWLQRGYLRLLRNETSRAIPDLERAAALHPGHDLPVMLLVSIWSARGAREDTLFGLAECLRRSPNHAQALDLVAQLPTGARDVLHRLRTGTHEERLASAPSLLDTRRWGAIELETARLVREAPGSAQAWFLRGDGLMRRSLYRADVDPAWAQAALERACQLDPAWADALALLALCRAQRHDLQQAAHDGARALELDPRSALAWAVAVRLRGAQPGPDRAAWVAQVREACERALALGSDSLWTWYEVGGGLSALGDGRELQEHYAAAGRARPNDPVFLTMAGFVLKNLGEAAGDERLLAGACEMYDRAIAADRDYGPAWVERGWAQHLLARPELAQSARRDLAQACELRPGDAHAAFVLGLVSQEQGDPSAAIEAYRECLRRDPANSSAHARLTQLEGRPPGRE